MKEKLTIKERIQALRPGQIIWPLVIILVIFGVGVGIYNYQKDVTANKVPSVVIQKPADNTTITDQKITLNGTVDSGDKVTINSKSVAVNSSGQFSADLTLAAGKNTVTIVATGPNGKSKIITRQVTRVIPVPVNTSPQVSGANSQVAPGTLTQSGPETYYVISAALIAAALVGWYMTRQRLAKALVRR